jgi:sugar-specific transcriptional regulator TrmB
MGDLIGLDPAEVEVKRNEILSLLTKLGLSDYEAKAYLALVMRSHGSADDVAAAADIPRTSAYKVLESLRRKNYIITRGGRPAIFHPVPPQEIKERVAGEVERVFRQMESLKGTLSEKGTPQLVYTITGQDKVLAKIGEMLDAATAEFFISSPELYEIIAAHSSRFARAVKRGVKVTVVAEPTAKVPEATEVIRKADLLATDVITDGELALISTPDHTICGYTDNPFLVAYLENFFMMSLDTEGTGRPSVPM